MNLRDLATVTDGDLGLTPEARSLHPTHIVRAAMMRWRTRVAETIATELREALEAWELLGGEDGQPRVDALHEALCRYTDELPAAALSAIDLRGTPEDMAGQVAAELWRHLAREKTANQLLAAWGLAPLTETPPKRTRKSRDTEPGEDPDILRLLRAHSAVRNTELCALLGTNPGTLENWTQGKYPWHPTAEQVRALKERAACHRDAIQAACKLLDEVDCE